MEPCGDYELQRAIGWGVNANFFAAQAAGHPGEPHLALRIARTADAAATQRALRSAAEQQAAVTAGCRQLAPILDTFVDARGRACIATLQYENSLGDFLEAGGGVDSELLRAWVGGLLGALGELAAKARRLHGNIKPGNILFDATGQPSLTDLAPGGASIAGDLHAVGTLIYQLVRKARRVGFLVPPLDRSPEWTQALGEEADHWREYTNRLLAKDRNHGPEALIRASEDLKHLARLKPAAPAPKPATVHSGAQTEQPPAAPVTKPGRKVAALVAMVIAGCGFAGWALWTTPPPIKITPTPPPVENDPLRSVRDLVARVPLPSKIATDPQLTAILQRIAKSLTEKSTGEDVQSLLGNWPVPEQLRNRSVAWQKAPFEWPNIVPELERVARIDVREPSLEQQLSNAIDADQRAREIENRWREIQVILAEINRAKDPLIPDFSAWAGGEIRASGNLEAGAREAAATREKLGSVRDFIHENWLRLHAMRFTAEAAGVLKMPDEIRRADWPREWERVARRYLRPPQPQRDRWQATLNALEPKIARRPAAEQPAWRQKEQRARAQIAEALDLPGEIARIQNALDEFSKLRDPMEEARETYRTLLAAFQQKAAAAPTVVEAQISLDEFKAATAKLPAPLLLAVGQTAQLPAFQEALKQPDKLVLPRLLQKGWTMPQGNANDQDSAVYSLIRPNGRIDLPFLRIRGTKVAMSCVEMPLAFAQFYPHFLKVPSGPGPTVRGADWLWKGPVDFLKGKARDVQPPVMRYNAENILLHDNAGAAWPLTWINFDEARGLADELGGRLPMRAEWDAIPATSKGPDGALRGEAWERQLAFMDTWKTPDVGGQLRPILGSNAWQPDVGSFSKQAGLNDADNSYLSDRKSVPGSRNNFLWLRSVYGGQASWPANAAPKQFFNLIGNAAEWVMDGDRANIIGGSAVSPPSLLTNRPLPFPRNSACFDVTFRLVTDIGEGGGSGEGLKKFKDAVAALKSAAAD